MVIVKWDTNILHAHFYFSRHPFFLYAYSVEGPMRLEAILALGERLGTSWTGCRYRQPKYS